MNRDKFEETVKRFEGMAGRHPGGYRFGAILLALAGYLMVLFLLALALGFGALGVFVMGSHGSAMAIKLVLIGGVFSWFILRSLWVRLPAPTGDPLKAKDAPELFKTIEEIRRAGDSPKIHKVLLTRDYNASVVQYARLGILGWYRNYLVLGLPLMMGLDKERFRAVLAHELGHLSGAHSKLSSWIYRLRVTWAGMSAEFERRGTSIGRFFNWYLEYFSAYTFVLSRMQEIEADRFSARVTSPRTAAEALVSVELHGRFLDSAFWPGIQAMTKTDPHPSATPFTGMREAFHTGAPFQDAMPQLEKALLRKTNFYDSHPSLSDRLKLLKESPRLPSGVHANAGDALLGPVLGKLVSDWDQSWKKEIADYWAKEHKDHEERTVKLETLNQKVAAGTLEGDEDWERASLVEALEGAEKAATLLREILAVKPGHVTALFHLGRILLSLDKEEGIGFLEQAMEKDRGTILESCEWIAQFWEGRGLPEKARPYWNRVESRQETLVKVQAEKFTLTPKDTFVPHGLEEKEVGEIRSQFEKDTEIKKAYLVRKELKTHDEEKSSLVLAVTPQLRTFQFESDEFLQKLQQRVANSVTFPSGAVVIALGSQQGALLKRIKKVAGSEIYSRKK